MCVYVEQTIGFWTKQRDILQLAEIADGANHQLPCTRLKATAGAWLNAEEREKGMKKVEEQMAKDNVQGHEVVCVWSCLCSSFCLRCLQKVYKGILYVLQSVAGLLDAKLQVKVCTPPSLHHAVFVALVVA